MAVFELLRLREMLPDICRFERVRAVCGARCAAGRVFCRTACLARYMAVRGAETGRDRGKTKRLGPVGSRRKIKARREAGRAVTWKFSAGKLARKRAAVG